MPKTLDHKVIGALLTAQLEAFKDLDIPAARTLMTAMALAVADVEPEFSTGPEVEAKAKALVEWAEKFEVKDA